jgi:hypothetical protein
MSYKFHHRASGRQLLDTETLSTAAVRDGDILRLQPEITAGGRHAGVSPQIGRMGTLPVRNLNSSQREFDSDGKRAHPTSSRPTKMSIARGSSSRE